MVMKIFFIILSIYNIRMSFTLVINNSNLSNPNTNATYTYNFIGGGFTVDNDMEVMLSSAQIPYSILI